MGKIWGWLTNRNEKDFYNHNRAISEYNYNYEKNKTQGGRVRSQTHQVPGQFGNHNFGDKNPIYNRRGTLMSYIPDNNNGSPIIQNFNAKKSSFLNNQNNYIGNYRR